MMRVDCAALLRYYVDMCADTDLSSRTTKKGRRRSIEKKKETNYQFGS